MASSPVSHPPRHGRLRQVLFGQIRDYIAGWNTNPTPFSSAATADEILATVQLVQTNKKLVDSNAE